MSNFLLTDFKEALERIEEICERCAAEDSVDDPEEGIMEVWELVRKIREGIGV